MKIIVTGSLGNIGKPLTKELIAKGHAVTVISTKAEKKNDIEALGAAAAIGNLVDVQFLTKTFASADAVYCMESALYSGRNFDLSYIEQLARNYAQAIQQAGVKRVVNLSSIGAHTNKGNGALDFYFDIEAIFKTLPSDVAITFMRPVGFYGNLFSFIPAIKTQGVIASNYGADDKKPWVSPIDIASAIAEEITTPQVGRKAPYVASDEISCNDTARILGEAIGKPDLKWIIIPDEQVLKGLIAAGMNPQVAKGFVEMNASTHSGKLYEDYYLHRPALGKVKMKDFAQEFATVYKQK
ncbi:MAG TPA: NAD(P)H-binding protein [Anaerolineales bacterium]|nr:NAD(P)H-binding protein [Anaerolineales bacterium]